MREWFVEHGALARGAFAVAVLVSLAVSGYVYDYAGLYELDWLPARVAPAPSVSTRTP